VFCTDLRTKQPLFTNTVLSDWCSVFFTVDCVMWCTLQGSYQSPLIQLAESRALLSYYAASSGDFLQTFRENLSVPIGCPETSAINCHYSLRNNAEERSSRLLRSGSLKSHISTYTHFVLSDLANSCVMVVDNCFDCFFFYNRVGVCLLRCTS